LEDFRPMQRSVINVVMSKEDCLGKGRDGQPLIKGPYRGIQVNERTWVDF
jgi:hypothetical protein